MILIDSGPLVALVDADDQYHLECSKAFRALPRQRMSTIWPVLTEAMHFVADLPEAQDNIWELIVRGVVEIFPLGTDDVPRIRELMHQYANRPMDFADAALLQVAEREGIRQFFTIDRKDFAVYRLHGKIRPRIIP